MGKPPSLPSAATDSCNQWFHIGNDDRRIYLPSVRGGSSQAQTDLRFLPSHKCACCGNPEDAERSERPLGGLLTPSFIYEIISLAKLGCCQRFASEEQLDPCCRIAHTRS